MPFPVFGVSIGKCQDGAIVVDAGGPIPPLIALGGDVKIAVINAYAILVDEGQRVRGRHHAIGVAMV